MNPANCPSLQKSLAWCEGAPSHPGIRRRVFFCNKNLIVAYPTLPRDELGRPTSAVLQGNFELQADAYWQFLDINIDKSTVKSDPQGERPSQTQLNKGTFLHNGVGPEATAAAAWLNNSDNVYVYEDMLGRFRVLGNNKWTTTSKVTQDQGQGTNPASTLIEVEVTDEVAAPFYNGPLETEEGTVMPETEAEDDNEGSTIGATVRPNSFELGFGQTGQIEVNPEDTNWTFESSNSNIASVNGNGLVTAGKTIGNAKISCKYKGIEIKLIPVTVGIMQGEDPDPNDPETPSGEGGPTYTKIEKTITDIDDYEIAGIPEGSHIWPEDEGIANITWDDNAQKYWLSALTEEQQETVIHCYNDGNLIDVHVLVLPPSYNLGAGESVRIDHLCPASGWSVGYGSSNNSVESVSVDPVTGQVDILAKDVSGNTSLNFTNTNGDSFQIDVVVDENAAG